MKKNLLLAFFAFLSLGMMAQSAENVLSVAQKANNYFMAKYADPTRPTFVKKERPSSLWTRAVYYEGLMALQDVDPQQRYLDYALQWADFHKWTPRNGVNTTDADDQCCGQTYIELLPFAGKSDSELLKYLRQNLDNQMASGRHDYWTWIDAIQMAMPLYAMMYKLTGERKYLDYAMESYRWSRNECGGGLFNTSNGFWFRDKDYVPPYKEPDGKDCYWSRGDGWVYAALVRVMQVIGKKDRYYKELKKDFLLMSQAFASCQREDGLWNASLVSTNYAGKELTGTSLFLYGMSWGMRNGLLKTKTYRPICDKAWKALENDCVHADGFLGYVQGTGKDPSAGQPVTYTSVPDFEDYGTGCFLLGATEYYRLLKSSK
ncbi:MAG: glycoside hydrolase family 88 protein [Prevotella sp.]|nr:glycoside hydrolase family 88 protein [Prevotella sp.]